MKVNKLHVAVLESLGLVIDGDTFVKVKGVDGKLSSVMVDKQPLVIPTREMLSSGSLSTYCAFAPLSENIVRGESPVLRRLREMVGIRITTVTYMLMLQMLGMAADTDYQRTMPVGDTEFLDVIKSVDETTIAAFTKVIDQTDVGSDHRLVNIFFKRGGVWRGDKYSRVAVVSFPIIDALTSSSKELFGVKLRVNDKKQLAALFKYILPGCDDRETYSYGSNSHTAPYFDSLMRSYISIAEALNRHTRQLREHLEDADDLLINIDWESMMEDLANLSIEIPPQAGNDGDVGLDEQKQQQIAATNATSEPVAPAALPTVRQAPAIVTKTASTGAPAYIPPATSAAPVYQPTGTVTPTTTGGIRWGEVPKTPVAPPPAATPPAYTYYTATPYQHTYPTSTYPTSAYPAAYPNNAYPYAPPNTRRSPSYV